MRHIIKKCVLLIVFAVMLSILLLFPDVKLTKASGGVPINSRYFSNDMQSICKLYYDLNKDGYLSQSEIQKIKKYEITDYEYEPDSGLMKKDFRGMEYFTSLETINLEGVEIKNLKLDRLNKLKSLSLYVCRLDGINFEKMPSLCEVSLVNVDMTSKYNFSKNKKLKKLILNNKSGITKLDVSKLKKLEYLAIVDDIKKIDLSKNKKLKVLAVTAKLKKLNLLKNKKLEVLELDTPNLKKIDISQNKKIKSISVTAPVSQFDMTDNKNLKKIFISSDECKSMWVNGLSNLKEAKIEASSLSLVDVSGNVNLKTFDIKANLTSLDLNGNTSLKNLTIDAPLENFDISGLPSLVNMTLQHVKINELNLVNTNLNNLYLNNSEIRMVDISNLHGLERLEMKKCSTAAINTSENNSKLIRIHAGKCSNLKEITVHQTSRLENVEFDYANEDCKTNEISYDINELRDPKTGVIKMIDNMNEVWISK